MKYLILALFFLSSQAEAMKLKVRAREHFESHKIKGFGVENTYKGLSNTINVWWEMPYELSYGFAISPIISSLEEDQSNSIYGDDIVFINLGFEAKYFVHKLVEQVYLRIGLGYSQLNPSSAIENLSGYSTYFGAGYELPLEMLGVAFEAGFRYSDLERGVSVSSFVPAIGFHLYEIL